MNRHIEKYLDHYLEIPTPDYAVMLKGEWGCGKTYFIKKYIKAKKDKKICYISLNGIKQCNDVIPQILLALAPKEFNSKICKGVISVGRTIAYGITKFFNVDNVFNIGDLANCVPENIVFVFDDLERTLLEPKEVLGFLSDLVEQQNFHVIIIGDETKFIEDAQEEYLSRKEKIIGKTFSIQSQEAEVLPELINEFNNTGLKDLLQEHLNVILLVIDKVNKCCQREQVNYRIIKAAIREFHFAFESIFENEQLKEYRSKIFEELFLRFWVIFYCLQTKFFTIVDVEICAKYFLLDDEKTEKRMNFRDAFPLWIGDTFIEIENWLNIFEHKSVNVSDLVERIHSRMKPDIPNWEKLWKFYVMEDQDIEIVRHAVLEEIEKQEHQNPFVILHIFMIFITMSKKGFINAKTSDVVCDAKKYLDLLEDNLSWNDISADINFHRNSYCGYGYHADDSDEFKEITAYLELKIRKKCKHNIDACYKDFINNITDDERAYAKLGSSEYLRADIFTDSDPLTLWNKLISLTPKAFREITHYMNDEVIRHHLCNKKSQKQFDFWKKIISLGENFLNEHLHDNKAKCLHLREDFLPKLREMVREYEQQ